MFYVSIVLNIPLGRIKWEYRDSVSVVLVSARLLLTPADNSYTPFLFERADLTLSGNPSTEEELIITVFFINLIYVVYILGNRKFRYWAGPK